jgi:hypothetical protein
MTARGMGSAGAATTDRRMRGERMRRAAHASIARASPAVAKVAARVRPFKGKRAQREGSGKDRTFRQPARDERPSRIDPDSPFAKLAALRDQLKK